MRICKVMRGLQHDHPRADALWCWCNNEGNLTLPETAFRRKMIVTPCFTKQLNNFGGFQTVFETFGIAFARLPDPWLRASIFTPYFIRKVSWVIGKSFLKAFLRSFKWHVHYIFATVGRIAFIFMNYSGQRVQDILFSCIVSALIPHTTHILLPQVSLVIFLQCILSQETKKFHQ